MFRPSERTAEPRRVLLEGDVGVGKTTALKYLAEQWSRQLAPRLVDAFKLVLYVDLKVARGGGGLLETLLAQCLPPHQQRTVDQLYNVLKQHQKRVLLILDGYEYVTAVDDDVWDVLQRAMFRDCSVVLSARSERVTSALTKLFDRRLLVAGVMTSSREQLISRYAQMSEASSEVLTPLLERLQQEDDSLVQLYSVNPSLCLFMCLLVQHGQKLDFTSYTGPYTGNCTSHALQCIHEQSSSKPFSHVL